MRENTNWESAWYSRRYSSTLLSQVHGGRRWTLLRPGALLASPGTRTVSRPTNCGDMRRQAKLIVFVASVILRMFFFQIPALRPDALFSENVRNDEPILLRHDVGRVQQQTLASFFDTFPYLAEAACSLSLSPVLVNVRPVDIAVPHRYSTTTP